MLGIDLNDSDTTCRKNFGNAFFETISTNYKSNPNQYIRAKLKKILVFKDQFFSGQKRFRRTNIDI